LGQQPTGKLPAFDAASVRPFTQPAGGWAWGKPKPDPVHFRMPGAPLRYIILTAYGLDDYQLTGLPDWAAHEFFTIDAVTDAPTPPDQMLLMLRQLLAERFQLQITQGEKEQPVWAIVTMPGVSKLKLYGDDEKCHNNYISSDDMKASGAPQNAMSGFNGCTMADLVAGFNRPDHARDLGRPVIDKTGLTGRYHMLVWQETELDDSYTGPGQRMSYVEPFREAVEKELGLKLVEDKQTMHYINVVSVSRPSPN
jgi:uncharacterized protein (TIGR03435 family)